MELILKRLKDDHKSTVGELYIDGRLFCVTCEDTYQPPDKKVYGKTRIPAGRYQIKMRKIGRASCKYGTYLREYDTDGMIWLQDVPNFKWIYMHIGNAAEDSLGCILVAESILMRVSNNKMRQTIMNSRTVYRQFHQLVKDEFESGAEIWITIIDN